jgi:hypothetical protein
MAAVEAAYDGRKNTAGESYSFGFCLAQSCVAGSHLVRTVTGMPRASATA